MLRHVSIEKLRPAWDRWSHAYIIHEEDATVYAVVPGGNKELSGDNCILEFFSKKTRGSTSFVTYNFSAVLDVALYFSSKFCKAVDDHRLAEEDQLQVCSWSLQLFNFPKSVKLDSMPVKPGRATDTVRGQ